jgi:deazaflavin-dependent oxidoreductase (nitroreductase family)
MENPMTDTHNFNDWDRRIIEAFRANGGNVGGPFAGVPILLLTTTGAKSGVQRTRPLAYLSEGGHIYVFAGNRGGPTNPAWYHNLIAHPDVTVEVGTEKFAATAIGLDDAEAERLGRIQLQRQPGLADTMSKIIRKVPAVLLEPKEAGPGYA